MTSNETITTRVATPEDIDAMATNTRNLWIEHAVHAQDLMKLPEISTYDYHTYVGSWFESEDEKWFVAVTGDGRVVGSVKTEIESDRNPLYMQDRLLLVDEIAVASEMRRRGVGAALLKACTDYASEQGIELVKAVIYEWNEASATLFERQGFEKRRADFFLVNNV